MTQKFRITYATLSADNEELQAAYDAAVDEAADDGDTGLLVGLDDLT